MDDIIKKLEMRIQTLIKQNEESKKANQIIIDNKLKLARENETLLTKYKSAISQIEAMLTRLKSIEKPE